MNFKSNDTISTANDSGISSEGQQKIVLNGEIELNSDVDLDSLELEADEFDSDGNQLTSDNSDDDVMPLFKNLVWIHM